MTMTLLSWPPMSISVPTLLQRSKHAAGMAGYFSDLIAQIQRASFRPYPVETRGVVSGASHSERASSRSRSVCDSM